MINVLSYYLDLISNRYNATYNLFYSVCISFRGHLRSLSVPLRHLSVSLRDLRVPLRHLSFISLLSSKYSILISIVLRGLNVSLNLSSLFDDCLILCLYSIRMLSRRYRSTFRFLSINFRLLSINFRSLSVSLSFNSSVSSFFSGNLRLMDT